MNSQSIEVELGEVAVLHPTLQRALYRTQVTEGGNVNSASFSPSDSFGEQTNQQPNSNNYSSPLPLGCVSHLSEGSMAALQEITSEKENLRRMRDTTSSTVVPPAPLGAIPNLQAVATTSPIELSAVVDPQVRSSAEAKSKTKRNQLLLSLHIVALALTIAIIPMTYVARTEEYLKGPYSVNVKVGTVVVSINAHVQIFLDSIIVLDSQTGAIIFQEDPLTEASNVFKRSPKAYKQLKAAQKAIVATLSLASVAAGMCLLCVFSALSTLMMSHELQKSSIELDSETIITKDSNITQVSAGLPDETTSQERQINRSLEEGRSNNPCIRHHQYRLPQLPASNTVPAEDLPEFVNPPLLIPIFCLSERCSPQTRKTAKTTFLCFALLVTLAVAISITTACSLLIDLLKNSDELRPSNLVGGGTSESIDISNGSFNMNYSHGPYLLFISWGFSIFVCLLLCGVVGTRIFCCRRTSST